MSDASWRVEYLGDGVVSNRAGAFQRNTIAYVDEGLARELATVPNWNVTDPSGKAVGQPEQIAFMPAFKDSLMMGDEPNVGAGSKKKHREAPKTEAHE